MGTGETMPTKHATDRLRTPLRSQAASGLHQLPSNEEGCVLVIVDEVTHLKKVQDCWRTDWSRWFGSWVSENEPLPNTESVNTRNRPR